MTNEDSKLIGEIHGMLKAALERLDKNEEDIRRLKELELECPARASFHSGRLMRTSNWIALAALIISLFLAIWQIHNACLQKELNKTYRAPSAPISSGSVSSKKSAG